MSFEFGNTDAEASSQNEKLSDAKTFLESLSDSSEISKISGVSHRHVDMIIDGKKIWINFVDGFSEENGFEFLVDDADFTNQAEYRAQALGLLGRAQKIKDDETRAWYAEATNFLKTIPESYEIENGRMPGAFAAAGTIEGRKIWVHFVDGLHEGADFELSIDNSDFTNNEQYRAFALGFLERVKRMVSEK